ncbi:hypothetical protein HDEF_2297 [Candidatus Hamiltonella defensa 5AT (Acyrthosiphon pisum)]|uniref:Uncharacterized protein n=1 Tax=Hamiltonella defensa subsp. Acyrthosiphon pisum (strain 5AT) TaxID=572265 RepID=C4K8I0_HAMD5|nr:hypothetical protein HDEF_2297 [Candidatus Hamiltonella defensa 5AT (Acyrthosiphon pisum)]
MILGHGYFSSLKNRELLMQASFILLRGIAPYFEHSRSTWDVQ